MRINPDIPSHNFAIVTPWYGHQFGGAEKFVKQLAEHMQESGYSVKVLTTACSSPYVDWGTNDLEIGTFGIDGVEVQRFRVDQRDADRYAERYRELLRTREITISSDMENELITNSINSSDLNEYIEHHAGEYFWIFAPYMYGTTIHGVKYVADRSFIFPCLHDEPMAYLHCIKDMFSSVRGVLCLSVPEKMLIERLYGLSPEKVQFIGCGIEKTSPGIPERFKLSHGIQDDYFIYIGKKDRGKNLHELIRFFDQYIKDTRRRDKLVLIGPGEIRWVCEGEQSINIIDVGVIENEQTKNDAIAGSIALCHPSVKESFSIVIMEAWLQECPVVVDYSGDVTRDHCTRSNGGLFYRNYWEFYECLELLSSQREIGEQLGKQGKKYVMGEFSWDAVLARFARVMKDIFS